MVNLSWNVRLVVITRGEFSGIGAGTGAGICSCSMHFSLSSHDAPDKNWKKKKFRAKDLKVSFKI